MTTEILSKLKNKIKNKTALIGVIGLGYVGLPFAVEKGKVGFKVIGVEQNPVRVNQINQGENYISDVNDQELKELVCQKLLIATTNLEEIKNADVIIICVPTPLTKNLTPNLSYIKKVTKQISKQLKQGQLISLESTTYPGTTDEIVRPILEKNSGLTQGEDFFLAHSPERVDPGNKRYTTKNTNKIVGASDANSLEIATFFYQQTIAHVVPVSSAKTAELVKVFENTFRSVNIALVNELTLLCDRMGLNVWEVLDAANTKPFGMMSFYPGPGVGGHCIPIDPHYLEWKAKEFNFETHFISLAGEINRKMPEFVEHKTWRILNKIGMTPSQAKILIIGIAYKKDLADCRESPALILIKKLLADGVTINYHDPYVSEITIDDYNLVSVPLDDQVITNSDLVIIITDHSNIDYQDLILKAQAVFDTRGVTRYLNCDHRKVTLL
jgi:UDP-N-acetyl-D-glucosamine dehydrogenase